MHTLKDFQEKAVNQLLEYTFDALADPLPQTSILLDAPTGSGKTVMMASLVERIVEELPMQFQLKNDICFIWFAPNTLHIQSFEAIQKMNNHRILNFFDLSYLTGNPALEHKDMLFVNWSTVDKQNNLWRRENETNTNLQTMVENTKAMGTQIVMVIDEAHLSAFSGKQAIEVRRMIGADVEIMVTATPLNRPQRTVSILRKTVIEEEMIKKGVRINIGIDPEKQNGEDVDIHLLRMAFEKRDELKKLYDEEVGIGKIHTSFFLCYNLKVLCYKLPPFFFFISQK